MEQRDEVRYQMLRSLCDREKYLEPFDYGSIELVEKLINDLTSLKKRFQKYKEDVSDLNDKNNYLILGINAYKTQNNELFKENSQLHSEIINLQNKLNFKGKDVEFNKLQDDKVSLQFLLTEANKKIEILHHQLSESKKKYLDLIKTLYEHNVGSPKMLDEVVKDYKVKLDPKLYDFEKYEKDLQNILTGVDRKNNSSNNNNFNANNNNNKSNEFLMQKCKELEIELSNKCKEIELLKKNINSGNSLEQKVVIDYLQEQLKNERLKFQNYLNYTLEENNALKEKQKKIDEDDIKRKITYSIIDTKSNKSVNSKYKKAKSNNSIGKIKKANNLWSYS